MAYAASFFLQFAAEQPQLPTVAAAVAVVATAGDAANCN